MEPFAQTRKVCIHCKHETAEIYIDRILVEGQVTEASIEYQKCQNCGRVDYATIFVTIQSQHHSQFEGAGYTFRIPADAQAWDTPEGDRVWSKFMPPLND
jgi:hypothetical protein